MTAVAKLFNKYKKISPDKNFFRNSEFCSSHQNYSSLNYCSFGGKNKMFFFEKKFFLKKFFFESFVLQKKFVF